MLRQRADVAPVAQPRVDLGVAGGVETGVGTIDGVKEGQQVHAAEQALQRARQQGLQFAHAAAAQAVNVGDELDLVFHVEARASGAAGTNITATAAQASSVPARRITFSGWPPSRLW